MKLTEKSLEVLTYVKENGGRIALDKMSKDIGRTVQSVSANVNDLSKKGLAERIKEEVEGKDKPVTFVALTGEGMSFVQEEE